MNEVLLWGILICWIFIKILWFIVFICGTQSLFIYIFSINVNIMMLFYVILVFDCCKLWGFILVILGSFLWKWIIVWLLVMESILGSGDHCICRNRPGGKRVDIHQVCWQLNAGKCSWLANRWRTDFLFAKTH